MPDQSITVCGNLTRDPELRYTASGRGVTNFAVACGHRFQRRGSDEWEEQTMFFNCTAWAPLGENVAATLVKGNRVIVTGRLEQREYENRDGIMVKTIDLICDEVGPSLKWATAKVEQTEREKPTRGDLPPEEPF